VCFLSKFLQVAELPVSCSVYTLILQFASHNLFVCFKLYANINLKQHSDFFALEIVYDHFTGH